jgi:metallo-beta-lactamase class B
MSKIALSILLSVVCLYSFSGYSQTVKEPSTNPAEWSVTYQPFRIAGNLYYVGTEDLACYLITTPKGHILINTGLASSAVQIKSSVEKLGFTLNDIKILLTTQAHFDHMGAMAQIKSWTGAKMMVDEQDVQVMEDGGKSDYALGGEYSSYAPVKADRKLHNSDVIALGGTQLTMLHHPGHTKGSCSYIVNVRDGKKSYRVLIANMPTIVTEHPFAEVKAYPKIAADYAYTLQQMKGLSFDIWLTSHASQFDLHHKHKAGDAYHPAAFIDRKGYDESLKKLGDAFAAHQK